MPLKPTIAASMPSQAPLSLTDLLDESEASAHLNIAVQTLRNWRWRGIGPRYCKLGARAVRYRRSDLDAFVEAGETGKAA